MITLRTAVVWFAERMETKLRVNDHKGHWSNCKTAYLVKRLEEETVELRKALNLLMKEEAKSPRFTADHETIWRVIREAADVANFAMMIADNAQREPRLLEFVVFGEKVCRGCTPTDTLEGVCQVALRAAKRPEPLEELEVRDDGGERVDLSLTVAEFDRRTPIYIAPRTGAGG